MRLLCLLILLVTSVSAQDVQIYEVRDFSGGLVNSVANALMEDNQLVTMENLDVGTLGNLEKRQGFVTHWTKGDQDDLITSTLIPYMRVDSAKLLTLRALNNTWDDSTAGVAVTNLTRCDLSDASCTTLVRKGYFHHQRSSYRPINFDYVIVNNNLGFVSSNGEFTLFDGHKSFPSRPYGPGQAKVIQWESGGNVTGHVRYKYFYIDTTLGDSSSFSAPTWPVYVRNGKVIIYDMWLPNASDSAVIDEIAIYREKDYSGHYEYLATIPYDSLIYIDNTASTNAADTTEYVWGPEGHCRCNTHAGCAQTHGILPPPGGMEVTHGACTTAGYGIKHDVTTGTFQCYFTQWSIVFLDSAGRESYMAAPTCHFSGIANTLTQYKASISNIPVPSDSGIVAKFLVRNHSKSYVHSTYAEGKEEAFFIVDTLHVDSTTYTDSMPVDTIRENVYCPQIDLDTATVILDDIRNGEEPERTCYDDSNIIFQPSAMVYHGSRAFAVGDIRNRNRLYYSDFGRMTTWPYDHFIEVGSQLGDWFVKLVSLSNDRLLLLRQNSIWQLTGLSFYQFSMDQVVQKIGAITGRSVGQSRSDVYFVHTSGIYNFRSALQGQPALSFPIQNSFDSIGEVNLRHSWGGVVDDDYWWSPATSASRLPTKTYIFSPVPKPHWKIYTIGIRDLVTFDYQTYGLDYKPQKHIAIISQDGTTTKLARRGYSDAFIDLAAAFNSRLKTKAFLEGPGRKKILWVEVLGSGTAYQWTVTFWDRLGTDSIASETYNMSFTNDCDDRRAVNQIVENFSISINDNGNTLNHDYQIHGIRFAWIPWDEGKK